jgi:hypothetical protein
LALLTRFEQVERAPETPVAAASDQGGGELKGNILPKPILDSRRQKR